MAHWFNPSGHPLSSQEWLAAHHNAKLPERISFTKSCLETSPKRVVDLGCGPGFWLELFNHEADPDCEFIGLDNDEWAISLALERARQWNRQATFKTVEVEKDYQQIPEADLLLAFNICTFLQHPNEWLEALKSKIRPGGTLIVRQYDGALLRFGPIEQTHRLQIESSLWSSTMGSKQFHHYDIDRVFQALRTSSYSRKDVGFETFSRVSPFPSNFLAYFDNMLEWTIDVISKDAAEKLKEWYTTHRSTEDCYFIETDLVAWLS